MSIWLCLHMLLATAASPFAGSSHTHGPIDHEHAAQSHEQPDSPQTHPDAATPECEGQRHCTANHLLGLAYGEVILLKPSALDAFDDFEPAATPQWINTAIERPKWKLASRT